MCRSVIVDAGSELQLDNLLRSMAMPLVVICPDRADLTDLAARFSVHRFIGANELADPSSGVQSESPPIRLLI